jgi:hypothetical protein
LGGEEGGALVFFVVFLVVGVDAGLEGCVVGSGRLLLALGRRWS